MKALKRCKANDLIVHILAAVARAELNAISTRTTEALAAAKVRGQKLGNPNGAAALRRAEPTKTGTVAIMRNSTQHAERLWPIIDRLQGEDHRSLSSLAKALNDESIARREAQPGILAVRDLLPRLSA